MNISDEMVGVAHAEYHKVLGDKSRSYPMRAALEAALADRVVVPIEPTEAMIDAACVARISMYPNHYNTFEEPTAGQVIEATYKAMISAAPLPQKEG